MTENGQLEADMTFRIQSGLNNWKMELGVPCDRRISLIVKGKVYKTLTVVITATVYSAETWIVKEVQKKKLVVDG